MSIVSVLAVQRLSVLRASVRGVKGRGRRIWRNDLFEMLEPRLLLSADAAAGLAAPTNGPLAPSSTVEVSALWGIASEQGPTPGVFEFTRTGDVSGPLDVNYTLAGTATKGSDYLVWETTAQFDAGSGKAWVTVLPRNDALVEGAETIRLTIAAGAGYEVGASDRATVTVYDSPVPNSTGVREFTDNVPVDMQFLDTVISDGQLGVGLGLNGGIGFSSISIYIDADQNPMTGDYRQGYIGGAEYRIDVFVGLGSADFQLCSLPTNQFEHEKSLGSGHPSFSNNTWYVWVPTSEIGSPSAADVFAVGYRNQADRVSGNGDRIPDYGWLDTSSRQVVVPRPGRTTFAGIADPVGDSSGLDLVGGAFRSVADQFFIEMEFAQAIDPTSISQPLVQGAVTLDTDRSLTTGSFELGDPIPTWGGDVELLWQISGLATAVITMNVDSTSKDNPEFGGNYNDGQWRVAGNGLLFAGSLSAFDTQQVTADGNVFILPGGEAIPGGTFERVPTDGRMLVTASTLVGLLSEDVADALPGGGGMFDIASGATQAAFSWDPDRSFVYFDPLEFGTPSVNPLDIAGVVTQLLDNDLVVNIQVGHLAETDLGLYEIALDTDMNAQTGEPIYDAAQPGNPLIIGAERVVLVGTKTQNYLPTWIANLQDGEKTELHEAWARPDFSPGPNLTGAVVVTIPLAELGDLGSQLRFTVASGDFNAYSRVDVAPPQAIVVNLSSLPTLGDMDGNGVLDAFDVDDFEQALADRQAYIDSHPGIDPDVVGDLDGSGTLDAFDVDNFEMALVEAATTPIAAPLPDEPMTIETTAVLRDGWFDQWRALDALAYDASPWRESLHNGKWHHIDLLLGEPASRVDSADAWLRTSRRTTRYR